MPFRIKGSQADLSVNVPHINTSTGYIHELKVGSITVETGVITVNQLNSSQSGSTIITSGSQTYTLPVVSPGVTFKFIIGPGETVAKWNTVSSNEIYGSVKSGSETIKYSPALDNTISLGIINGGEFNASHGDVIEFHSSGNHWYVSGTSQKNSFTIPRFTLTVLTDVNSNGFDNNQVIKSLENTHIVSGGWGWTQQIATSHSISPASLNVIHLGNVGPDIADKKEDDGLGRSISSRPPAFMDPLAPLHKKQSQNRTIEINRPIDIVKHNISQTVSSAIVPTAITSAQILSTKISSMKIVFRVGDNSYGNSPDMYTNLMYGLLTVPENLWGECFSEKEGRIEHSLEKPESYNYDNGHHNNSHLEDIWSVKKPYSYNQVSYNALQSSEAYRYMRTIFNEGHSACFSVSGWWTQGTTTTLSDFSTKNGWKDVVLVAADTPNSTGGTLYEQVYGTPNKSFISKGRSRMSGHLGWADDPSLTVPLWDVAYSLSDQPLSNRQVNQSLVPLTNPPSIHMTGTEQLHTPIVYGNSDWISYNVINIPSNTTRYRFFQTSYTGGGSPANDSYSVAAVQITISGTYNNSL